jgi:hypothetical protein
MGREPSFANRSPRRALKRFWFFGLSVFQLGCTSLLPSGSTESPSSFSNFESARQALVKVVPNQTTLEGLSALGFNPQDSANVTLIPYPEVVGRLVPYSAIQKEDLDPGVRACISAQAACRAYVFRFSSEQRKREGGFWLDFLNIKRVTNTTGWRFEGLVVVNDQVVLFRNYSGEERIDRTERQNNPLGPFQPAGESAGRTIFN